MSKAIRKKELTEMNNLPDRMPVIVAEWKKEDKLTQFCNIRYYWLLIGNVTY